MRERQDRLLLRRRRRRVERRHQRLGRLLGEIGLHRIRDDAALVRLLRPVLRHREVPVRQHQPGLEVLQVLLELVEIGAVPGQEALPAVLAMVLVDQRLVVVAAPVLRPVVEIVELAEAAAQALELRLAHAVDVHAPPGLAGIRGRRIAVGSHRKFGDLADLHRRRLRRLARRKLDCDAGRIIRAAGIDPVGNAVDVGGRDALAAPWQRREAAAIERRFAAQSLDQSGCVAARMRRDAAGVALRHWRDHLDAEDLGRLQRLRALVPKPSSATIVSGAVAGSFIEDRLHARISDGQCFGVHSSPRTARRRRRPETNHNFWVMSRKHAPSTSKQARIFFGVA